MKENLTPIEITKVEQFCSDIDMFEAVKKVLLSAVYYSGTLRKGGKFQARNQAFDLIAKATAKGDKVTNEELGEELRGLFFGVDTVEQGFAQLKTIKSEKEEIPSPYNEAV